MTKVIRCLSFLCFFIRFSQVSFGQTAGTVDVDFDPDFDGFALAAIARQPDGKLIVGGYFRNVNGYPRRNIARLNEDGSLDGSFDPDLGISGSVGTVAVQPDGKILIGGSFTFISGNIRNRIARLNSDGTLDMSFEADADSNVETIHIQADGKILVGGWFSSMNGEPKNRIARLNIDGSLDQGFNPDVNGSVYTLVTQTDGKILLGGNYTAIGGQTRNFIARINEDGTLDSEFNPVPNGVIHTMALQSDGKILLGGGFTSLSGQVRNRVARLHPNGSVDINFDPNVNDTVRTLTLQADGKILVGGDFSTVKNQSRSRIVRLATSGFPDNSFTGASGNIVFSLALQSDGKVLVGSQSSLTRLHNEPANTVLGVLGTSEINWYREGSAPEIEQVRFEYWNGSTWQNTEQPQRMSHGWQITDVNLPERGWVRAQGRAHGGFQNNSSGIIQEIIAYGDGAFPFIGLSKEGESLLPGVSTISFGTLQWREASSPVLLTVSNQGDAVLENLAVHLEGVHGAEFVVSPLTESSLPPGHSTSVAVLFSPTSVGSRNAILSITSNDASHHPFSVGLTGTGLHGEMEFNPDIGPTQSAVFAFVTQSDGKIMVGGNFTSISGQTRNRIARLNADGSLDMGFDPNASGIVYAMAVQQDGRILIGGNFTSLGGQPRSRLARLNADGVLDESFNPPSISNVIRAVTLQEDGKILIGGSFTNIGGQVRNRIARLNPDGTLDETFICSANSDVYSLVLQPDGKIIAGGFFTSIGGQTRNRIARLNTDGALDELFNPDANNAVNTLILQANGKILVGGNFTNLGGQARNRLARLQSDGTLDEDFDPNVSNPVHSLALQTDGKILLGGEFGRIGEVTRNRIARLNPEGTLDPTFNPGASGTVRALMLQPEGNVLAGGDFFTLGGQPRNRIARLQNDPAHSELVKPADDQLVWHRGGSAPEIEQVQTAYWDGATWQHTGTAERMHGGWQIINLNLPASAWLRVQARTQGGAYSSSSTMIRELTTYGGGSFPSIDVSVGGEPYRTGAASLDFGKIKWKETSEQIPVTIMNQGDGILDDLEVHLAGDHASDFSVSPISATSLAPGESTTIMVSFRSWNSGGRNAILKITSNDMSKETLSITLAGEVVHADLDLNLGFFVGDVMTLARQQDGKVLLGGGFNTIEGQSFNRIARMNADGSLDTRFNPNANNNVHSIAVQPDGKIIVGGTFSSIGDQPRGYIARLHEDGSVDDSFNAFAGGAPATGIFSLALQPDGKIVIAGSISTVDGQSFSRIARLNSDGSLDQTFNVNVNNTVLTIGLQPDGKILVGGLFTTVNGLSRNRIARLHDDGTVDENFDPNSNGFVTAFAIQSDGGILVGGGFANIGGQPRDRIARLNQDGSADEMFLSSTSHPVTTFALQSDGKILVGGDFTSIGNQPRNRIARLYTDGTLDLSFDPNADGSVKAVLLESDGRIMVAGGFTFIGGEPRNQIARLRNDPAISELTVTETSQINWRRDGGAPDFDRVEFAYWDGTAWQNTILPYRYADAWQTHPLNLPINTWIRAQGFIAGGWNNNSSGMIEEIIPYGGEGFSSLSIRINDEPAEIDTASIKFTGVQWGAIANPVQVSITNDGDAPLEDLALALGGTHAGDFTHTPLSVTSLAPGENTTVSLFFNPTGSGNRVGILSVLSNDRTKSPFKITLAGSVSYLDNGFNPGAGGIVHAIALQPDERILLAGNFNTIGEQIHRRIARLNVDGSLDEDFNQSVTGGAVRTLALQSDRKILIGGSFTQVDGLWRNHLARLNPDGSLDDTFTPAVSHQILSLVLQADGKILIGGSFTSVGGETRNRIARLSPNGSLDATFNPDANGAVQSIAIQANEQIVIGGNFTAVNGQPRNRIARLNPDGTLDETFNPPMHNTVFCLAIQPDGKILAGGGFTGNIRRLNSDGTNDEGFNVHADSTVRTIAIQSDGKIIAGGDFKMIGGRTRNRIARLHSNGVVDPDFDPNASLAVHSITLLPNGNILVGGNFNSIDGQPRSRIARLHNDLATSAISLTGNEQLDWQRGGSAPVIEQVQVAYWDGTAWQNTGNAERVSGGWRATGLHLPDDTWVRVQGRTSGGENNGSSGFLREVIVKEGGLMPSIALSAENNVLATGSASLDFGDTQWKSNTASIDVTITNEGGADLENLSLVLEGAHAADFSFTPPPQTSLGPGESTTFTVSFHPMSIGERTGRILVYSSDAMKSPFWIRLTGSGLHGDENFSPEISSHLVSSIAVQPNGRILIGGDFTTVNGHSRNRIARLNSDGSLDAGFNPDANSIIHTLALQPDGKILVGGGGSFTSIGGQTRYALARLYPDGSVEEGFSPTVNGSVNALAVLPDSKILVGGFFPGIGIHRRHCIALLSPDGTVHEGFNADANDQVNSLALQTDGKILAGGNFTSISGFSYNRIVRLWPNGWPDDDFNPNANGNVKTIVVQPDGKILVGGDFTIIDGQTRNRIARLNPDGSLDPDFNPGANNTINTFALQADGKILVGGTFTTIGGRTRSRIARLNGDGTVDVSFDPSANHEVNALALKSDGSLLVGGRFMAIGGLARNRLTRLQNDPATSNLSVTGTSQINWQLGGSAPEVEQVQFSYWNGSAWLNIGNAQRVSGGWRAIGLSLPSSTWVRAHGHTSGGQYNSSSGMIQKLIHYGGGAHPSIALSVAGESLESDSAVLNFDSQRWREISSPVVVTITNQGGAALNNLAVALEDVYGTDFVLSALPVTHLPPGGSTHFSVQFRPNGGALREGWVSVTSNDMAQTPFRIRLTGIGIVTEESFNPDIDGVVKTFVLHPGGKTLVGGDFNNFAGEIRDRIARLNEDGTLDDTFNPGANGLIRSLAVQSDGRVLVGGDFTMIGGHLRNRIARLNMDGTLDSSFNLNTNNSVRALAIQPDGRIVVGGDFTMINGHVRNRIARLNADGTLDDSFHPDANSIVYTLAIQPDGKILAGGNFTRIGGMARNLVARLNTDGTLDTLFNPNADGTVFSLAVQPDGKILAGGSFSHIAGQSRNRIARLNLDGALDAGFNPNANNSVYSFALQADGKILVGGTFKSIGGQTRNRIARLNPNGTVDPHFDPNAGDTVNSIAIQSDGAILLGGRFTNISGQAHNRFARVENDPASSELIVTGTSQIHWQRTGSAPEIDQVAFTFWDGNTWQNAGNAHRVSDGWQADGLALPGSAWIRAYGRTNGGQFNGSSGAVVQISSYGGFHPHITLVANDEILEMESSVLNLGSLDIQQVSDPIHLTIANQGNAVLNNISIGLGGMHADDFTMTSPGETSLSPGESTSFLVSFHPLSIGNRMATLSITSSDVLHSPFPIALAGIGMPIGISEPLSPSDLDFILGGDSEWYLQGEVKRTGHALSARSGDIGNNSSSWIETTVIGPGILTYWRRVSSRLSSDHFRVRLNGSVVTSQSGELPWAMETLNIPEGIHTVRWEYTKGYYSSMGLDAAFLDEVVWMPGGGYATWPILEALPVDRRAPTDLNGPLNWPNLLAFAMGVNPLTATWDHLPSLGELLLEENRVQFIFQRNPDATGVNLIPYMTTELNSEWVEVSVLSQSISPLGDGNEEVVVELPLPEGPLLFIRLEARSDE
ncbi:MAG: choice-of-anchor D domain-containing protein [Verrucomicrobia bacterium]|nr:choice-of-anchor D domain-containing protein [Verrucomicrobiota bacterium]MCH8528076.1 choice-of-anchor D domain-containing protein [Kiritimatiellia bacterium]